MKNFLAIYLGSADANAKMEITDAQKRAGMDKWMKWVTDNAGAIVDVGSPLGKTKKINAGGVSDTKNRMTAYDRKGRLSGRSCALHSLSRRLRGGYGMPSDTGNVTALPHAKNHATSDRPNVNMTESWPDIPFETWKDTCATLQLWLQIVGKYRLRRAPWINHGWHATFYVTARGLTTSLIPVGSLGVQFDFDFVDHKLIASVTNGSSSGFALAPMTVTDFYARFLALTDELHVRTEINRMPNEVPDAVPFDRDTAHASYDAEAVTRFWQALVQIDRVLKYFRTGFLGKASPVHLFWGSFDLAVTRFSGRRAPLHPGGVPGLPDAMTREAYSHEVSSAGFWPGGGPVDYPAFYPTPPRRLMASQRSRSSREKHFLMRRRGSSCCPTASSESRLIPSKHF
jgi:hypothetical protein